MTTTLVARSLLGSLAGLVLLGGGASRADTLCLDGEYPAFSCAVTGGEKQLAICLHDNAVIYRFGKIGHVELEYPGDTEEAKFVRAQSPFPEGIETVLRFDRGNTRYVIDDEEVAAAADASSAWVTVTRGKKQLAKLDCAAGFKSDWKLLDNVLPATPGKNGDALGTATEAPASAKSKAPTAAAAPQNLACAGEAELAPYPKKVAGLFRKYAETTDTLFAFAVKLFGAPQACALNSALNPNLPGADSPDESNFSGTVRYTFKDGPVLLFTMQGQLDASLIVPAGFADEAGAKAALEARAGFPLAKAKKASKDNLAQALQQWVNLEGRSPPDVLGAGTATKAWTNPRIDADEQTTYAELTYRGKKLVAIRTHQ